MSKWKSLLRRLRYGKEHRCRWVAPKYSEAHGWHGVCNECGDRVPGIRFEVRAIDEREAGKE